MSWLQWQLARESARSYEQVMVSAVLLPAAEVLVDRLKPSPGDVVLDAGCGTGTVSRLVVPLVGPGGRVVGVDVNPNMIDVARQICPSARLDVGDVRELACAPGSFDLVYAAHTVQFVAERSLAVQELARVTRAGGRVGVTTWSSFDRCPYFAAVHDALLHTLGADVAGPLAVACSLGDAADLQRLLVNARLEAVAVEEVMMNLPLEELGRFVPHHLASTPMAGVVRGAGDEAMAQMINIVTQRLGAQPDRPATVPFSQLVASATKA
jgi:ubiquinone/menaquinone biosynthesis C-methylase UbiE